VGLLLVGIGIGLLASGIIALVRAIGGRGSSAGGRDQLHVAVARSAREPWAVAFREGVPPVPSADLEGRSHVQMYATLREHGAVDFGATELTLMLNTHHEDEVLVSAISVSVVRRDPPFTGRLVGVGPTGEGATTPFVYDLDAEDPGAKAAAFFVSDTIKVRRDEPVDVTVVGTTSSAYCQWRIHIDTLVGEQFHRMTVDDKGLPFETTGCERTEFAAGLELLG
jgi:hypothetical protein